MFDPCLGDADRVCSAYVSIPLLDKAINYTNTQKKKSDALFAFSFAYAGAKEKAIKKKTPK